MGMLRCFPKPQSVSLFSGRMLTFGQVAIAGEFY